MNFKIFSDIECNKTVGIDRRLLFKSFLNKSFAFATSRITCNDFKFLLQNFS